MIDYTPALHITKSHDAQVINLDKDYWHLELPSQKNRGYYLAQLDDHGSGRRRNFHWKPPLTLHLQACTSAQDLQGTWGFGFWNDPFSFLLGSEGAVQRLPVLPDAAWFFHASPPNYLSFRDDLPAQGFLAAIFKSIPISTLLLALTSPAMALTLIPGTAQWVRTALRRWIQQDAVLIHTDETAWHTYEMDWGNDQLTFYLDGKELLQTKVAPSGPLSLVLWIDNQYAALPPRGGLRYGTLPTKEPVWLEIREFSIESPA